MVNVNLMKGDCLELMKSIPDGSVDLILTDPPYNIARSNNFHTMGRKGIDFGEWDKGFDLFSGSCSTGVACLNTNRKFIGIELDNDYFDIGAERMRNHIKNE